MKKLLLFLMLPGAYTVAETVRFLRLLGEEFERTVEERRSPSGRA